MAWADDDVERIAREFHNTYEYIAGVMGWETQQRSRVKFDDLPESNRKTMLHTVRALLEREAIHA
jgi:hypothetical protein